ncbi:MAG: hypothetical protein K2X32_12045 [Phycisphaerales bacterium]|nr:hypothetical protein [Phycisphaerales bacterium]
MNATATRTTRARPWGWARWLLQRGLAWAGVIAAFVWYVSLSYNFGFGIVGSQPPAVGGRTARPWLEASLVRGGFVVVSRGTRTSGIDYDPPSSQSYHTSHRAGWYTLDIEHVGGPIVWWPSVEPAGPWSGPYVIVPLWPLAIGCGAGALVMWLRARRAVPGCCAGCGYSTVGLAAGAPCPECGDKTSSSASADSR